ncbi:MAG: TonB family protein [Nitrospiraceae bacterium]
MSHVLGVGGVVFLMAGLSEQVVVEPFRWNVAVIEAPAPPSTPAPAISEPVSPPIPARPATPPPRTPAVAERSRPGASQRSQPVQAVTAQVEAMESTPQAMEVVAVTPAVSHGTSEAAAPLAAAVVETSPATTTTIPQIVSTAEATAAQPISRDSVVEFAPATSEAAVEATERPVAVQREMAAAVTTAQPAVTRGSVTQRAVHHRQVEADFGWLRDTLWGRIEQLKRYPMQARANHWEGRVVVEAVIREDGEVVGLHIAESSGREVLDQEAMVVMKKASPLRLKHPLGRSQVTILVPITYRLDG